MATSSRRQPPARTILALYGPTASGKTAVAGLLRERLGAEVVSADSASLYAGMPILTAAPPYPARLVGITPVTETMSVGAYRGLAHRAIDDVLTESRLPLVVGGTGLYLRAALADLSLPPATERRRVLAGRVRAARPRAGRTRCCSCATRAPPRESTRTTANGSCAHSSLQRQAVPSRPRRISSGRPRRGCRRRSSRSPSRSTSSTGGSSSGRWRWSSGVSSPRREPSGRHGTRAGCGTGARPRAVRDPSGRRGRPARDAVDAPARAVSTEVAAPHAGRRYPRRQPACRGDRR